MNWLTNKIAEWLIGNLTEAMVKEWADRTKVIVVPWLRLNITKLLDKLDEGAKKTETKIDDAAVKALRTYLDALLPDNPAVL